jgi:hypothetical protein
VTVVGHGRSEPDDRSSGRNLGRLSRSLPTGLILGPPVRDTAPSWLANILSLLFAGGGTQVRQNSGAYSLRRGDRRRRRFALSRGSLNAASEALKDLFSLSQRLILSGSNRKVLVAISLGQIGRNGIKPVISTSKR